MNYLSLSRLIIIPLIIISAIWLQTHTIISGDITWLMQVGKRLLAGGHYYRDFVEVNPPMAIYLYLIPVMLSAILNINFIVSVTVYIFGVATLSWLICCYLFTKLFNSTDQAIRYITEIVLAFALFILPAYAFGQREHFLVMFMMPYLLLAVLRLQQQTINQWLVIGIGITAGIGFAIKPFFLLAWLIIEFYMVIKTKALKIGFRQESMSCLSVLLLYSISILLFTPDYLIQSKILIEPVYYLNYRSPLLSLLTTNLVIVSTLSLVLYGLIRKRLRYQPLSDLLALSIISMLVVFFVQQTLWFYHILPVLFFTILLLTLTSVTYLKINNPFKFHQPNFYLFSSLGTIFLLLGLLVYALFIAICNIITSFHLTNTAFSNPIYAIAKTAAGKPIYIFTSNIATNYPLIDYAHSYSPSAFPCLWLISAAHSLEQVERNPKKKQQIIQIANYTRTIDINNIIAHKPLFIFVQLQNSLLMIRSNSLFTFSYFIKTFPAFDFLSFFLQDQRFAQFWQNYQYKGQAGLFAVYELRNQ